MHFLVSIRIIRKNICTQNTARKFAMCGRFKRKSDKQRVAQVFALEAGLDETDFAPGDDLCPQSMQPVIYLDQDGERRIEMMRWGFKLPDRLLFNARSEGIAQASFWKDAFLTGRAIAPGDAIFEWKEMAAGEKKPKYEITIPGQEPFGMAAVWKLWKNPKTNRWEPTFTILTGEPGGSIHSKRFSSTCSTSGAASWQQSLQQTVQSLRS
jgi:putative SOS response-associated peptidase YedK